MTGSYQVKIDAFEGPLDLLLHFIKQEEIDIYDIPVAKITEQYMVYIQTMQELELDVASEYLVMAATLLALKSKLLLPQRLEETDAGEYEDAEVGDPREELVLQLLEYRTYKELASVLREKEEERVSIFSRSPVPIEAYYQTDERKKVLLKDLSFTQMFRAYERMLVRLEMNKPIEKTVRSQAYSIEERMEEIIQELSLANGKKSFQSFIDVPEKSLLVVSFLAVLELVKAKTITCEQVDHFAEITIYLKEEAIGR